VSQFCGDMTPIQPKMRVNFTSNPVVEIDFSSNAEMSVPFFDWMRVGGFWAAFAEWYLDNKSRYES
jgi:hypothetical protein